MPSTSRRHDLDWLRIVAFTTLIFYHVGMFYVTWDWHVKSDYVSSAIEPAMRLVNPWRLILLFFISGVALRFALDKRGPRQVAGDRLGRLLRPLGVGMLVLVVPQAYLELRYKGEIGPGYLDFYPRYLSPLESFSILTPTWNHLWYLAYILIYALILAVAYRPLRRLATWAGPTAREAVDRAPWLVLVVPLVALVTYAVVLAPRFPTTHAMYNDWANHAESFTVLLLGWCAAKSKAFWDAVERCRTVAVFGALVLGAWWLWIQPMRESMADSGLFVAGVATLRTTYAWFVIVAILAVGQRLLNRPSPALTYATEAVIVWYILHQSITVILGYQFIGSGVPLWAEASVLVGGTILGCVVLHEFVIRRARWLRPLFGLRSSESGTRQPTTAGGSGGKVRHPRSHLMR